MIDKEYEESPEGLRERISELEAELATTRASRLPSIKEGEVVVERAEIDALREFAASWEAFASQLESLSYHHEGMGCGIEDRGITDRYEACEHGWDCALERVEERLPEVTSLDALRSAHAEGGT